ncbi:MAG: hypothetical protein CL596_00575 [Alteromonas sp.]|nr:hypothetical protein [Alteromonas sp.]MAY22436.1 hypothetical protein [Flavobacteriaceae bacterium]|tara:strand:+ start:13593 stop:13973 length:381 start_codon:yes stop_codon:yes gene_type:complete
MKARNTLFLLTVLLSFSTLIAQKGEPKKPWIILESLKKDKTVTASFKQKAVKTFGYLDSLKVKDQEKMVQVANTFEKAVTKGEGKKILTKKDVMTAKANHPGKNQEAIKKRFQFYIKQMERVFDDE